MSTPSAVTPASVNKVRDTIRGGRDLEVQVIPPSLDEAIGAQGNGGYLIENLFVRKIPFLQVDTVLLPAWGNNLKELIAYTGKDEAYFKTLSEESQIEVLKLGRELNFFILKECLALQTQVVEAHGQGSAVRDLMEKAVNDLVRERQSQ